MREQNALRREGRGKATDLDRYHTPRQSIKPSVYYQRTNWQPYSYPACRRGARRPRPQELTDYNYMTSGLRLRLELKYAALRVRPYDAVPYTLSWVRGTARAVPPLAVSRTAITPVVKNSNDSLSASTTACSARNGLTTHRTCQATLLHHLSPQVHVFWHRLLCKIPFTRSSLNPYLFFIFYPIFVFLVTYFKNHLTPNFRCS